MNLPVEGQKVIIRKLVQVGLTVLPWRKHCSSQSEVRLEALSKYKSAQLLITRQKFKAFPTVSP